MYISQCDAWARLLWRPGEFKTSEWIKAECVSLGTKYLLSRDLCTCTQKKVFLVSVFAAVVIATISAKGNSAVLATRAFPK